MMRFSLPPWFNRTFWQSPSGQTSLTRKTLLKIGVAIVGISSTAIGAVYWHSFRTLEDNINQQLYQRIVDEGRQNSEVFRLAQENQQILKQHLLQTLKVDPALNTQAEFKQLMYAWRDGTWRNFPQGKSLAFFDKERAATVFLGGNVPITPDLQHRVVVFHRLASLYGRAFTSRFTNTWINGPENLSVDYRPSSPWGLEAESDLDILQEEYGYGADRTHNPARKPFWTKVYYDTVPKQWMVSLVTPVDDDQGNHVASIGNDIVLNDLLAQTQKNLIPGTHNLIFRNDGTLIVHPQYTAKILEQKGQLTIQDTHDRHLQRILAQAKQLNQEAAVFEDPDGEAFWAITKLQGPDWYFVTVYPMPLLIQAAFQESLLYLAIGSLTLTVELLILYRILRHQVHQPLNQLLQATEKVARGEFDVQLDCDRTDELGRLARSFTSMAAQLQASFHQLGVQNEQLEVQVQMRTMELSNALQELQSTQSQLIQSEKMSSLGQMVAGIAHEINNPVSFIYGNLSHAETYIKNLLDHLALYQQQYPDSDRVIPDHADEIDLEFVQTDLPKLLHSMQIGTDRIREIVVNLRNFSRLDEAERKLANIHDGIESTLLILNHRLKPTGRFPGVTLHKSYGDLPEIECYPGQLNQVLMNLLSNAIDALTEHGVEQPTIWIETEHCPLYSPNAVVIRIRDNGPGIPPEIRDRIFDPFFTTKPVGKGTGLGLAISYQVVVDRHQGYLSCRSEPGMGTEFCIELPIQSSYSAAPVLSSVTHAAHPELGPQDVSTPPTAAEPSAVMTQYSPAEPARG